MLDKIEVTVYKRGEVDKFEVSALTLPSVFSVLEGLKGKVWVDGITEGNFSYILSKESDPENPSYLTKDSILGSFVGWDSLFIVEKIEGEDPFTAAFAILGTTAIAATTTQVVLAYAISVIMSVAASMAISMVMSLLSPTQEFSADPSVVQKNSNLFNGAPLVRDQGGSVPLVFGNPYCGAVLISSGLYSEEKTI